MPEILEFDTEEEWIAERSHVVNASEVVKVLGFKTGGFTLFYEKRGEVPHDDLSSVEAVQIGHMIEQTILDIHDWKFKELYLLPVPYTSYRSTEWPWLSCTPDTRLDSRPHMQLKNVGQYLIKTWDPEPPLEFQIQVQTELAVLERERAYLTVLFGGNKLERFEVVRNEKFIAAMVVKTKEFMDCVNSGEMPDVDESLSCEKALKALHPNDNVEDVALGWAGAIRDQRRGVLEVEITEREAEQQYLSNWFRSQIGGNTYGVLPDCTVYSLKTQRTAHNGTTRVLRGKV